MHSIRGVYNGKEIVPLEEFHIRPNVKVIITFIEDESEESSVDKHTDELLALSGTWEDNRAVEDIIREIYESRTVEEKYISL